MKRIYIGPNSSYQYRKGIKKAILARRVIFVKCHFDNGGQKGATLMR